MNHSNFLDTLTSFAAPLGRIFLAAIFILAGLSKIGNYAGMQAYMEAFGLPGVLLPLVIVFEVATGLALIVGFQTRIVAFLLAGFSLLSALVFHTNFGDEVQFLFFMKNVAIAGGLLMIVANGGGAYSLSKS